MDRLGLEVPAGIQHPAHRTPFQSGLLLEVGLHRLSGKKIGVSMFRTFPVQIGKEKGCKARYHWIRQGLVLFTQNSHWRAA